MVINPLICHGRGAWGEMAGCRDGDLVGHRYRSCQLAVHPVHAGELRHGSPLRFLGRYEVKATRDLRSPGFRNPGGRRIELALAGSGDDLGSRGRGT